MKRLSALLLNSLLVLASWQAVAAPVQVAPGSATNYRFFDRLSTANGTIRPPGTNEELPVGASGCGNLPVSWTVGGNTCSGSTGVTRSGNMKPVTSTGTNVGIGNFTCSGTTFDYTYVAAGSTCAPPPPTTCSPATVSWTVGTPAITCSGAAGSTAVGSSTIVNSSNANSGTGNFTCGAGGTFTYNATGSTCTPPPPANCTSQTVNWTQGTNNCSVASGTRANGSTVTMNSTNGNNGAASVTCNSVSNTYSVASGATCFPNACTSQTINWTVGGRSCSAPSGSTTHSTSRAVSSTSGNVGSATVTCNAQTNTYSTPTGTTCNAPAATACTNQTVSWTQGSNTCSGATGTVNNNASQSITTNTSGRIGSATVTCSAAGNTYTVSGGTCAPSACTNQTINWSQGGNACSAPSGATNNGVSKAISSTNANQGSVTIACNSTTGAYTQSNATCAPPPPTSCAASTRTWQVGGVTCSALVTQTNVNTSRTVSSSNGNTGNATFPCTSSGTFGTPTGASCAAPPPVGCAAANVTWTASGNTCSGSRPAMNSGTNRIVTNTTANRTGSATYSCTNGTVTQGAVSCVASRTVIDATQSGQCSTRRNTQFTIPAGATSARITAIGGGGSAVYSGGGGGAYAQSTIAVIAGQILDISVGEGGAAITSHPNNTLPANSGGTTTVRRGTTTLLSAQGGVGQASGSANGGGDPRCLVAQVPQPGGSAASSIGTIKFSGGRGSYGCLTRFSGAIQYGLGGSPGTNAANGSEGTSNAVPAPVATGGYTRNCGGGGQVIIELM